MRKPVNIEELRKRTKIKDLLFMDMVIPYIHKRTGTTVTRCRVGRWINSGDLSVLRLPGYRKYRVTRRCYVDGLICKFTAA